MRYLERFNLFCVEKKRKKRKWKIHFRKKKRIIIRLKIQGLNSSGVRDIERYFSKSFRDDGKIRKNRSSRLIIPFFSIPETFSIISKRS